MSLHSAQIITALISLWHKRLIQLDQRQIPAGMREHSINHNNTLWRHCTELDEQGIVQQIILKDQTGCRCEHYALNYLKTNANSNHVCAADNSQLLDFSFNWANWKLGYLALVVLLSW